MRDVEFLGSFDFIFNPNNNGGEHLCLRTRFYGDGEKVSVDQELTLSSYGNSASFTLTNAQLTPENLRSLADKMETEYNEAVNNSL